MRHCTSPQHRLNHRFYYKTIVNKASSFDSKIHCNRVIDVFLYPRLKDCREDKEKTQAEIGDFLGIDQRVYSNYETGKRQIPLNYLIKLALLYKTSLDYLVGLTNNPIPYERKRTK